MVVHPFVFRLHRLYWAMTMCWVLFCSQTLGFVRRVYWFRPFGGAPLPLSIGIVNQRWPVFWVFSTRVYSIVCDLYAAVGCAPPFLTAVLRVVFTLFCASLGIVLRYLCVCRILLLSPSDCVFIILMAPVSNSLLRFCEAILLCDAVLFTSIVV